MKTITLKNTENGWVSIDKAHIDLFGTDTIPTAFTKEATEDFVVKQIAALNPNAVVQVQ